MQKFEIGDKIIVINFNAAELCSEFQNKILTVKSVLSDRVIVNTEIVKNSVTNNNFFPSGYAKFKGIVKATKLHRALL